MPIEVTMPRLSDTMEQGTVVKWNVGPGDEVSPGKVIADIETDKATMELEAFDEGTIARLVAEEGQTVAVGSVIAVIAEEGEDVEEAAKSGGERRGGDRRKQAEASDKSETGGEAGGAVATDAEQRADSDEPESPAGSAGAEEQRGERREGGSRNGAPARDGGRIFASPLARKLADERGLDLGAIDGSGPGGRIVKRDVEAAAEGGGRGAGREGAEDRERRPGHPMAAATVPGPVMEGQGLEDRTVALSNMRSAIARRLVESKTTIPHYQVTVEADMDALMDLRERLNTQLETQGVKLSVNDFLVRACAVAMRQHPFVNSSWSDKGKDGQPEIKVHGDVNIGVAIALPVDPETLKGGGLVVGVLRQSDRMGLRTISSETRRLAKKAREKGLSLEEMEGSTFTISNLGMYGVEHFTAIINPPNACILAVGAAVQKPVVRDGELVVGHRMAMTMSSDHRIVDGAMAAEYLVTLRTLLENPATLLV